MLKKGLIFLILISMMFHCASRMNLLSYLYENRQEIAFSLGLINEIPIASCHHDYDFDKGLKIVSHDDDESGRPVSLFQAREIILFFQSHMLSQDFRSAISTAKHLTLIFPKRYTSPGIPIFHPPA